MTGICNRLVWFAQGVRAAIAVALEEETTRPPKQRKAGSYAVERPAAPAAAAAAAAPQTAKPKAKPKPKPKAKPKPKGDWRVAKAPRVGLKRRASAAAKQTCADWQTAQAPPAGQRRKRRQGR